MKIDEKDPNFIAKKWIMALIAHSEHCKDCQELIKKMTAHMMEALDSDLRKSGVV